MSHPINFAQLFAPFAVEDIEFRAGATNKEQTSAMALAYLTSRSVMNRLDEVVGPANWRDEYKPGPDGGVICGLSLRIEGEWITKWDGAENTQFESIKGGLSDAFKRAAVKWGIGRYLYGTPNFWVSCQVRGKSVILDQAEARAKFSQAMGGSVPAGTNTPPAAPKPQAAPAVPQGNGATPPQPKSHHNGNGNGNGHQPDPMTAFWMAARQRGLTREQGQQLLGAANGDAVKALAAMKRAAQRMAA